jgi:hypothetical protein
MTAAGESKNNCRSKYFAVAVERGEIRGERKRDAELVSEVGGWRGESEETKPW